MTNYIILLLFTFSAYCQSGKSTIEFNQLKGTVMDQFGEPFPGQNVVIKGTKIGTQTDLEGNFCLMIPKQLTVVIELPFCFEQMSRKIKQGTDLIEFKIGRNKVKSRRAQKYWTENKDKLLIVLPEIYNSSDYKNYICR